MKKTPFFIWIILLALLTVSPVPLHTWQVQNEFALYPDRDYPSWQIMVHTPLAAVELATPQDCLTFRDGEVSIANCENPTGEVKWQSGADWQVTEAIAADLNRDGLTELAMVVWRPYQPWPIDAYLPHGGRISEFQDRQGMSCHLILVGWDGNLYRELWAGSSLADPIFHIRTVDLDSDDFQELVALEGNYDSLNRTGNLTVWDWSGFGFRLRDRLEKPISDFGIVSDGQNVLILSN